MATGVLTLLLPPAATHPGRRVCVMDVTTLSHHPSLKLALNAGRGRALHHGAESITAPLLLGGCPQQQE